MAAPEPEMAMIGSPRPEFTVVPWLGAGMMSPGGVDGKLTVELSSWERVEDAVRKRVPVPGKGGKKADIVYAFGVKRSGEQVHDFKDTYDVLAEKSKRLQQIAGLEHVAGMGFPTTGLRDRMRDYVGNDDNVNARGEALRLFLEAAFSDAVMSKHAAFIEMFMMPSAEFGAVSDADDVARLEIPDGEGGLRGTLAMAKQFGSKLAHGANLQYLQIPPRFLSPESSIQKLRALGSHVQLLFDAPAGDSQEAALERMLCAVRYQLTMLTDEAFGKKPYNPVLGETCTGAFTHAGAKGNTVMIAEQVLHHPAVSALWMHNAEENVTVTGAMEAVPRFWGNTVEVEFHGKRVVEMGAHGETYTTGSPSLCFRGIMGMGRQFSEWSGDTLIDCEQSGLRTELKCLQKGFLGMRGVSNGVSGTVWKVSKGEGEGAEESLEVLASFEGVWDGTVSLTRSATGDSSVLYDGAAQAERTSPMVTPPKDAREATDTEEIWGELTAALVVSDWGAARGHKHRIETEEREKRKAREEAGDAAGFTPLMFSSCGEEAFAWVPNAEVIEAKRVAVLAACYP